MLRFANENNPKIHFDLNRKQFTFKNRFNSITHFVQKLFEEKIGVLEDQNLFDDVDKDQIDKVKKGGFLREINIEKRKSKPAMFALVVKNYAGDSVDEVGLYAKSSDFLRQHWNNCEKDYESKDIKNNNMEYLAKMQKIVGITKHIFKRKRKSKEEEDVSYWKNSHIKSKIEKSLKKINELIESKNKGNNKKLKKSNTL